jgi:hypothetical protein
MTHRVWWVALRQLGKRQLRSASNVFCQAVGVWTWAERARARGS